MKKLPFASAIEKILAETVAADAPGVVVGISHKGRLIHTAARGLANLTTQTPFSASTPFRICSISKQFIAALIWREIAAKRIALDAHPSRYLPWLRDTDANLQIAHLLQNKSGIRDQWVLAMMMGARAEQRFTLDDGNEIMRRAPMSMFTPGSQSLYCNGNFELLGQILTTVSGEDFATALHRHILKPLAMHDTFVGQDTSLPLPGDARGYRFHHGAWEEEANAVHWAASAGIVSAVVDLLKWDACLRDPRAAGLPWVEKIKRALPFNDGATASYASGINHLRMQGPATLSHQGALRGWRSILLRFVREDVGIAVFMNRTNSPSPQGSLPRTVAYAIARTMGIAPVGQTLEPQIVVSAYAAKSLPAPGWFVSRAQGLLIQIEHVAGQLEVHLQSHAVLLQAMPDRHTFQSADTTVQLQLTTRDTALLTLSDANVVASMARCGQATFQQKKFIAHGAYTCVPLASTLFIHAPNDQLCIYFKGIFGSGITYPLHILDAHTAWFDIPRGVDESPPGRVLVIFDAANHVLELSCPLARRMVFRASI